MGDNVFCWQSYIWIGIWISSKFVLDGFVKNTAQTIKVGSTGAVDSDDKNSYRYYIDEFSSSPYILQENKTIYGRFIESGELVFNGRYFSIAIAH